MAVKRRENRRKKSRLALVLGSGGARGLAHIGFLEVLEENNIKPDLIIGTSMGSLVGGVYACGNLNNLKQSSLTKNLFSFIMFNKFPKFRPEILEFLINKFTKNKKIEDLDIKFVSVATDIVNGKPVYIDRGKLSKAIMLSLSIPGFFKPVKFGNKLLVDGAIMHSLPYDYARKLADNIIAVNVMPSRFDRREKYSLFESVQQSVDILINEITQLRIQNAKNHKSSMFIQIDLPDVGWFDFVDENKIIESGRKTAMKNLRRIKRMMK